MGKIVEKILETLQFQAETTVDLLAALFMYPSELRQDTKRFLRYGPRRFKHDWAEWYRQRQLFYSLLNQLKRDGLVLKKKKGEKTLWKITGRGMMRLSKSHERHSTMRFPQKAYQKGREGGFVIAAFDIPERERKKRSWLRMCLAGLGFSKLQQSVWVGKASLPEDFIKDLRALKMIRYVHIFSVNKSGTLERTL